MGEDERDVKDRELVAQLFKRLVEIGAMRPGCFPEQYVDAWREARAALEQAREHERKYEER